MTAVVEISACAAIRQAQNLRDRAQVDGTSILANTPANEIAEVIETSFRVPTMSESRPQLRSCGR